MMHDDFGMMSDPSTWLRYPYLMGKSRTPDADGGPVVGFIMAGLTSEKKFIVQPRVYLKNLGLAAAAHDIPNKLPYKDYESVWDMEKEWIVDG